MLRQRGGNILARNVEGQTPLHLATRDGHVDMVRQLLDDGADLTAQDKQGKTALHTAAVLAHEQTMMMLMSRGANLVIKDEEGRRPYDIAVTCGWKGIADTLLNPKMESLLSPRRRKWRRRAGDWMKSLESSIHRKKGKSVS